jgi:prepilin-type N-terminal cleavage/methylation domain-containing protein
MARCGERAGGFTLIELMVTLTVLAILVAVGLPSMTDLLRNNRRSVLVNELLASFMLARAEASKTGQAIVVCGFDDTNGNHVLDAAERRCTGLDWQDGWMVARWNDADNDRAVDNGELLAPLRVFVNDHAGYRVTGTDFVDAPATGAAALLPFNGTGTSARLTVCDPRGAGHARAVDLAANGRTTTLVNATEDSSGVALSC